METKRRLFVYDRREIGILLLTGVAISFLAFTFGVHLGKRVSISGAEPTNGSCSPEAPLVKSNPETEPTRSEVAPHVENAPGALDLALQAELRNEVSRTGLKMDHPRAVDLPEKKSAGAVTPPAPTFTIQRHESPTNAAPPHGASAAPSETEGAFIQLGSYLSLEEAEIAKTHFNEQGIESVVQSATLKDKKNVYRVVVGPFASEIEARKKGDEMVAEKTGREFLHSQGSDAVKKKRILVVDDTPTVRLIVRSVLEELTDFEVTEAEDGEKAWALLKETAFDVAFVDWNMPVQTGLELLKRVRSSEALKDMPFIIITARNHPQEILEAQTWGASDYLVKPFGPDDLMQALRAVIKTE